MPDISFNEMYDHFNAFTQGDVGEVITAYMLRDLGFRVLRNLYLPYKNKFTEIDMVAISRYGIFVIENKNYKATIKGTKDAKYWKVEYPLYTCRLYNPVMQNDLHRDVLRELLKRNDIETEYLFNTVIFNDKCNLYVNAEKSVFKLSDFIDIYTKFIKNRDGLLTDSMCDKTYDLLGQYSDTSVLMRLHHCLMLKRG